MDTVEQNEENNRQPVVELESRDAGAIKGKVPATSVIIISD